MRNENGRFAPGTSGNPGGRPRMAKEARDLIEALAPELVMILMELARDTTQPGRVRIQAATALLDRRFARPTQQWLGDGLVLRLARPLPGDEAPGEAPDEPGPPEQPTEPAEAAEPEPDPATATEEAPPPPGGPRRSIPRPVLRPAVVPPPPLPGDSPAWRQARSGYRSPFEPPNYTVVHPRTEEPPR